MTHLTHHIAGETLIYKVSLVVLYTIVAPHCGLVGQCHSLLFWTCPFRWNGNVTWDVFFSLKFYIYMVMEVKTKLSVGNVINIPYGFLIFIIKKQFQNHIKYQFNGMYRDNVHSSTNYTPQETETKCPHKRGGATISRLFIKSVVWNVGISPQTLLWQQYCQESMLTTCTFLLQF